MIEVEIQNFQSVERVSLRIDGFTAIAGRSNIGKSSIVRALQCALTGAVGTDFVRHGPSCERRLKGNKKCRCQTTIRIKTSQIDVTWEKGDSVNQYTVIQGGTKKVYTAVDRGTPEFLQPEFRPIKVGDAKGLIQVSEQFSPIFLLNQSGPAIADVLSDVARLDNINDAIRLVNKDRKEAVATRKVREKDVAGLQKSLARYEGLEASVGRVAEVESQHEAVLGLQETVDKLSGFITTLTRLADSVRALGAATAPSLPDFEPIADQGGELELLAGFYDEVLARAPIIQQLKGIDDVVLPDIDALTAARERFEQESVWVAKIGEIAEDYRAIKDVADIQVLDDGSVQGLAQELDVLGAWDGRQVGLTGEIDDLTGKLAAVDAEEQAVLGDYDELGLCPTCSQKIDGIHRHAEPNGLLCEVCGEPQYETPSCEVCKNGHGGAAGVKP